MFLIVFIQFNHLSLVCASSFFILIFSNSKRWWCPLDSTILSIESNLLLFGLEFAINMLSIHLFFRLLIILFSRSNTQFWVYYIVAYVLERLKTWMFTGINYSYLAETPFACKEKAQGLLEFMFSVEGEDESRSGKFNW